MIAFVVIAKIADFLTPIPAFPRSRGRSWKKKGERDK
jgi:hypothetical protein